MKLSDQAALLEHRMRVSDDLAMALEAILMEIAEIVGLTENHSFSVLPGLVRELARTASGSPADAVLAGIRRIEERLGKPSGPSVEEVNRALLEGSMMLGQSGVPVAPRHQIVSTRHPVAPSRLPQLATIAEDRIPTDPMPESTEWVPIDPRPALDVGMMVRVRRPMDVEEGPSWPVEMNCYHGSVLRLVRPERRWWQVEEDGYVFSPDWLTPVRRAEPTPTLRPERAAER